MLRHATYLLVLALTALPATCVPTERLGQLTPRAPGTRWRGQEDALQDCSTSVNDEDDDENQCERKTEKRGTRATTLDGVSNTWHGKLEPYTVRADGTIQIQTSKAVEGQGFGIMTKNLGTGVAVAMNGQNGFVFLARVHPVDDKGAQNAALEDAVAFFHTHARYPPDRTHLILDVPHWRGEEDKRKSHHLKKLINKLGSRLKAEAEHAQVNVRVYWYRHYADYNTGRTSISEKGFVVAGDQTIKPSIQEWFFAPAPVPNSYAHSSSYSHSSSSGHSASYSWVNPWGQAW